MFASWRRPPFFWMLSAAALIASSELRADPVALGYTTPIVSGSGYIASTALWIAPSSTQSLLFAADRDAHAVQLHDPGTNTFVGYLGSPGTAPGQLGGPSGVAVAQDLAFANGVTAVLFVVESDNGRVSMFSLPDRAFRGAFGAGLLRRPSNIAVWCDGDRLQAWVTSTGSTPNGIDVFDIAVNGTSLIGHLARHLDVPTLAGPIAMDRAHARVFVADHSFSDVLVYDLTGTQVGRFGAGQFAMEPEGIAIYETSLGSGYVIVADRAGAEFEVFDRTSYGWIGSFSGPTLSPSGVSLTQRPLPGLSEGAFFAVHANQQVHCYRWRDIAQILVLQVSVHAGPTPGARLGLSAPNGEEAWKAGSAHDITWTSENFLGQIRIEFSGDGGQSWNLVAYQLPNTGRYAWTPTIYPVARGRIRISDPVDGLPSDASDADFRVLGPIARLVRVSGDGQTAPAGTALPAPFAVRAEDALGSTLPGIAVRFAVTVGNGSLSAAVDSTDASGLASTLLTLGTTPGTNRVEASVAGLGQTVTFMSTGQPPTLVRGPYLQQVTDTSALVVWRMTAAVPCSLDYGIGGFSQSVVTPAGTQQVVALDGLLPGNRYDYRIRCGTLQIGGSNCYLRTAPIPDSSATYRLLVWGDSGTGNSAQMAVAAVLKSQSADVALHVGDIIYDSGEASRYDPRYFAPYAPLLRHVPVWAIMGNHDAATPQAFLDAWYLPTNPVTGSERFYSFDYGDLHIVALDTNLSLDATLLNWLETDLQASQRRWKLVFFHHTMYSCGAYHGSDEGLISKLRPIFDRQAVDLVLYGHDHHYERSFPMRGNQPVGAWMDPDYRSPGGTIYIVTGGGASPRAVDVDCEHTAVALPISHFTRLDFQGDRLTVEAIGTSGQVVDRMTLNKGLPPPPRPEYGLAVNVLPAGAGSVQLEPPGGSYFEDTVVRLTAGAASGWRFTGWSGDLAGNANPQSLTMPPDHAVTAHFARRVASTVVTLQEVRSGGSAGSTTVGTTEPVQGHAADLYLAAVSTRLDVAVGSVTGLGLTWTEVRSQCAARSRTGVSLWMAQGTPTGSGPVSASLATAPDNAAIVVTRYSGVDSTTPILGIVSGNTFGVDGACTNGTDKSGYRFELPNTVGDGVVYSAVGLRDQTHTAGPGVTETLEFHFGSSGNSAGLAVCQRPIAPGPLSTLEGSFKGAADWAVVAVLLAPGAAGITSSSGDGVAELSPVALRAWPLPYRGGTLQVVAGARVGGPITIHDASGRLVRRLFPRPAPGGHRTATWNGRDESGRPVAAGIYLLTGAEPGERPVKIVVVR